MKEKRSQMSWMKDSVLTLGAVFAFFVLFAALRYLPLILKSLLVVAMFVNGQLV